jgi:hypothetical protein
MNKSTMPIHYFDGTLLLLWKRVELESGQEGNIIDIEKDFYIQGIGKYTYREPVSFRGNRDIILVGAKVYKSKLEGIRYEWGKDYVC